MAGVSQLVILQTTFFAGFFFLFVFCFPQAAVTVMYGRFQGTLFSS